MAGLISDIVGGNVDSDLDKLVAKLAAVEKELDVINGKAITIKVDLQGVGTLSELTNLYKQQDDILTKLRSTSVQYVDTYKMATEVIKQHNGHSKEFVAVSQGIAKTTLEEARARRENAKALLDEQKYIAALAKEKERIDKLAAKEVENLNKQKGAYSQLNEEYKKAAKAAQDLGAQQELLNRQMAASTDQTQRAGLLKQMQDMSPALKAAQQNAMGLHQSMLAVDMAVGKAQRNVGNYNGAQFAMSQLLREAPSFAYSFSTGLLSLSNNIPILVDEINRMKVANEALKASGAATIPIWKTLLGAFTSPVGMITIATAAITLFAARMTMAGNETKKATDALKSFNDVLEVSNNTLEAQKLMNDIDRTNVEALIGTIQDKTAGIEAQTKAYNDLKNIMPALTREYSMEEIANGKSAVAIRQKANYIIELSNSIKENKKIYEDASKSYRELDKELKGMKPETKMSSSELKRRDDVVNGLLVLERDLPKLRAAIVEEQMLLNKANAPDLPKQKKEKKEKKDTISDDLAAAKSDYELQLMLNQQKFANSRDTDMAAQQLKDDNLKAAMEYGERYMMIVEDFNNKELLTENEHIKLINEANKILIEAQIKAKEAGDKIEEERLKKSIEANKELLKYIESLSKQRQELEKINREIDNIQDKAASRKEYAESFAPYLEGFGFNTAFGQQVKQKNADISSRRTELGVLEGNKPTEASDPKTYGLRLLQWETNVAKEKENIAKMEADRDEMYNQKMIEGKKRVAQATIDFATTAINEIQAKQEDSYKRQLAYIDEMQRKAIINSQLEIQAIQGRTAYQIEKENEIAKVTAQARSQEAAFEAERRSISIAQAKFTRQNAIATAILNGAVGVTKIWSEYSGNPIVAAALTALQAGVIASQIQRAQSAPVPMYAKGTGDHKGGLAVIGDGGEPEFVSTPTGKNFWSKSTATLIDLPKHSTVTPLSKMQQFAANGVGLSSQTISELNNTKETLNDKRIVEKLEDIHEAFISNMMRGRTNVNVSIKSTTNRRIYNQQ